MTAGADQEGSFGHPAPGVGTRNWGVPLGWKSGLSGSGASGLGAALSLVARAGAVGCCCLALAQCGGPFSGNKYGVSASPRIVQFGEPVPKGGGTYRVGKSYVV